MRGSAGELAERFGAQEARGEIVVVVGGAPAVAGDLATGVDAVRRLVEAGAKPRAAAGVVAELTGTSKNALYRTLMGPPE